MNELFPLVPPEVDLRDFREMPLEFERLFASDTWVLGTSEEKVAAFHLWCKSWHQVPSSSLPDDDRILQHLSAAGPRWKKLRAHALRGWVKCTDGRFYHPVVAEKALRAWSAKLERRTRTHNARVAALSKKVDAATGAEKQLLQSQLQALLQEPIHGVADSKGREVKGGEEKGVEGRVIKPTTTPSAAATRLARREETEARTAATWDAFTEAYVQVHKQPPTRNGHQNKEMAKFLELVPIDEAPAIAAFYVRHPKKAYFERQHPVYMLRQDAAGLRTQWLNGRRVTEAEARQADQTSARVEQVHRLTRRTA